MALIRAVTLTLLLGFILVASALGAFVYLLSGYPSPEIDSFNVTSNGTVQNLEVTSNAEVTNKGGEGVVRVEFRALDSGIIEDTKSEQFVMVRGETRQLTKSFDGEGVQNIGLAVFSPGRPEIFQDRSALRQTIPEP